MTARTRPIAQLPARPAPRTRKAHRQPASGAAQVQSSHGDHAGARLRDISIYGCNLVSDADWLRIGSFVTIRLPADRSIQAIVRWVRGNACGVEFIRPIPAADADWLAEG